VICRSTTQRSASSRRRKSSFATSWKVATAIGRTSALAGKRSTAQRPLGDGSNTLHLRSGSDNLAGEPHPGLHLPRRAFPKEPRKSAAHCRICVARHYSSRDSTRNSATSRSRSEPTMRQHAFPRASPLWRKCRTGQRLVFERYRLCQKTE
jgi:hypothetical protein